MSTIKKFAGETAIYGVSTIASRILNFFLTPIYTKVYSRAVYGIFTEMYSYASILNALLSFGMETTFFRYLNKKEGQKEVIYSNTFMMIAIMSALFLVTCFTFIHPIAVWIQDGRPTPLSDYILYIKFFLVILVIDGLSVVPFARLRADGKPGRYATLKLINIITFICLNLFFIFAIPFIIKNNLPLANFFAGWYRQKWVGYVFISNLIASSLTIILLVPELIKLRFRPQKKLIQEMLVYSLPIFVANLSFIVNENLDKIFLGHLLPPSISEAQVGIYGACCKIAIFLSIFINAFRLGAEPFFFSHAKNENAKQTYATIMNYFVLVISLIFVGVVANVEILKHFIGKEFWEGLNVVPILLFGYVSLGIYMNLSIWYKLSDQTKYGLYISGAGAIITIILNLIFIPFYGYMASAWVSLIAYTSMMVLSYILGQRNYAIPYHLKKNVAYLISSIVIVWFSFVYFKRDLIMGNALFVIFGLIILYLERHQIKKIIASL
ncbi:polysaccharide biosynthesis C-terminal domain-containing protein [Pedobacter sp. SD-b]|uniref:Polysaccharide biosynthesis C-terminal domain-containing protein n=1 Tax=Pedobacter segetis TaxID=2793069 RepID=A0ABS1BIK4_9SPHI|nr:polysaccharide biosynthesis C-terminal domain-containing protein [Pedobacter segetis]MBK0382714.1 polysaccharide biosynthesis C-terminal domain-containing protein [Pedobacter segetis]